MRGFSAEIGCKTDNPALVDLQDVGRGKVVGYDKRLASEFVDRFLLNPGHPPQDTLTNNFYITAPFTKVFILNSIKKFPVLAQGPLQSPFGIDKFRLDAGDRSSGQHGIIKDKQMRIKHVKMLCALLCLELQLEALQVFSDAVNGRQKPLHFKINSFCSNSLFRNRYPDTVCQSCPADGDAGGSSNTLQYMIVTPRQNHFGSMLQAHRKLLPHQSRQLSTQFQSL